MSPTSNYRKFHADLEALLGSADERTLRNKPYMPLTIERLGDQPLVSLSHYRTQNGDLMRDPEVVFLTKDGEARPVYYRNDYAFSEHATVPEFFGDVAVRQNAQQGLDRFVDGWFRNLRDQGFFKVAQQTKDSSRHEQAWEEEFERER